MGGFNNVPKSFEDLEDKTSEVKIENVNAEEEITATEKEDKE